MGSQHKETNLEIMPQSAVFYYYIGDRQAECASPESGMTRENIISPT